MGYLLIDNSQAPPLPDIPNTKTELNCKACAHCGGIVAILKRGCSTFHLSSIDVAVAAKKAPEASEHYVGKYRCSKCHANLCRRCAMVMDHYHNGICPGPFKAKLERALAKRRHDENFVYHYRSAAR